MAERLRFTVLGALLGLAAAYVIWGRQAPPAEPAVAPPPPPAVAETKPPDLPPPEKQLVPPLTGQPGDATSAHPGKYEPVSGQPTVSKLTVEPPLIDLGKVDPETHHPLLFKISNPTDKAITIKEAAGSCGCLNVSPLARKLEPGESCELRASYHALPSRYADRVAIYVRTDEAVWAHVTPTVVATVHHELLLEPPSASFGMIAAGQANTLKLELRHYNEEPFKVLKIEGDAQAEIALAHRPKPGANGAAHEIEVTLKAGQRSGLIKGSYTIVTDNPKARRIPLGVLASVRGEVIVQPLSFIAMRRPDGSIAPLTCYLRRADNLPVQVDAVADSAGRAVEATFKAQGVQLEGTIRFKESYERHYGSLNGELIFKLAGGKELRVPYALSAPLDPQTHEPLSKPALPPKLGAP